MQSSNLIDRANAISDAIAYAAALPHVAIVLAIVGAAIAATYLAK